MTTINDKWHKPTETPFYDGDYICAFKMADGSIEYGWCRWDNKAWDILCDYDPLVTPIVAWFGFAEFVEAST